MPFLTDDFLLTSDVARTLYHDFAADMPIYDYHCHLPPADLAANRTFDNLYDVWLAGDHYKWRAMRAAGINEDRITGKASARDKFFAWAETVPHTARNPLYHWTHMELRNPLGIDDLLLGPDTAEEIWERGNARLAEPAMSVQGLLHHWKVRLICTTDDPVDDLHHHDAHAAAGEACRMLPAFRPDRAYATDDPAAWGAWVDTLGAAADIEVRTFDDLLNALDRRCTFFHNQGCRLADHGLASVPARCATRDEANRAIRTLRDGRPPSPEHRDGLTALLLTELGRMYHARGWAWQVHVGALRNVNTRGLERNGRDTGYDMIGDWPQAEGLARLFDRLAQDDSLPRTIVYNLNPADNHVMASLIGCFQDGAAPGKMQLGSGWWFLDQARGIRDQLDTLSELGLLSRFVGMLTDSRSFLSFSRHDYFRRVLCSVLGEDVEAGLLPDDDRWLGGLIRDIGYRNAVEYFRFPIMNREEP